MGNTILIAGQTGYVDPQADFSQSGWAISVGYAQHSPCNPGFMTYLGDLVQLGLITGAQYNITYTVDIWFSGQVYPILGNVNGASRTTNGTFTDTITWNGTQNFQFYSDGSLRISKLLIAPVTSNPNNGQTLAFCEKFKKFSTYYSFNQENYLRYNNKFFGFNNGQLYLHNSNSAYNNFNGVQYPSTITFYINIDSQIVKNYFSIRQIASSAWGSPNQGDIFILPHEGKPNGQQSRLKAGNYKQLQGDYFADFLRDMSDPRFSSIQDALFKGAELQGKIMQVTISNTNAVLVRIVSVDVMVSKQGYTYSGGE